MDETQIRATVEQEADPRVDLAVERTELALERTHLAWIRTMFTLITAGLAIDKGVEIIHSQRLASGEAWVKHGHFVGLVLTSASTVLLLAESIQFVRRSRQLAAMKKAKFHFISTGLTLAILVMLLGFVLTYLILNFG